MQVKSIFSENRPLYEKITKKKHHIQKGHLIKYGAKMFKFACRIIKTKIHRLIVFDTYCFRPMKF